MALSGLGLFSEGRLFMTSLPMRPVVGRPRERLEKTREACFLMGKLCAGGSKCSNASKNVCF